MDIFFSENKNKLKRGGLSRPERVNDALSPEQINIDDRGLGDLLRFFYAYARQVNYYQDSDTFQKGDWLPFFQKSVPFQYANIAGYDLEDLDTQYQELAESIASRLTFASLNPLFDFLFEISDQLARWHKDLELDNAGLKAAIDNLIETNLRSWFSRLVALANSGSKWGYQRPPLTDRQIEAYGISQVDQFAVDRAILVLRGSLKHRVLAARSILEEIYRVFWKGMEATVQTAGEEERLERSLTNEGASNHTPHLGLVFAFLKLFEKVQGSLNRLSTSHLDFFYRKTLKLKELPHEHDKAHVVFELAKQAEKAILIEKGVRFKAGKDNNGQEIFYALPEDTIVGKATVAEVKTLFIDQGRTSAKIPKTLQGVYAAPVANSGDGLGEAFSKEGIPSWSTVGAKPSKFLDPDTNTIKDHPHARLGFLVASKVLLLREGSRTITVTITLGNEVCLDNTIDSIPLFDLYLSTEKGWEKLSGNQPNWTLSGSTLSTTFTLAPDFPAVIFPEEDVLGGDYGHQLPLLKAELNPQLALHPVAAGETPIDSWYWELRQQEIVEVALSVKVCDVRQLVVQNDLSVMDANKPFQPFGPLPKAESSKFYIGNEEIFCKNWEQIDVNILWKDLPDPLVNHYDGYSNVPVSERPTEANVTVNVELLSEQNWIGGTSRQIFQDSGTALPANCAVMDGQVRMSLPSSSFTNWTPCSSIPPLQNGYTNDLECGFLRMELGIRDFLHDKYAQAILEQTLKLSKIPELKDLITEQETLLDSAWVEVVNNDDADAAEPFVRDAETISDSLLSIINSMTDPTSDVEIPNEPYTPTIESIRLDYSANDSVTTGDAEFIHLHPWEGTYEQMTIEPASDEPITPTLLPCFLDEGSLHIGLTNYDPGSLLQLYFAMEPSTADPTMDKAIVCWEYLRANQWHPLRQDVEVLSDTTSGLIQSGIVKLAIPTKISREGTTIMPKHLHWLKARVLLRTPAISETLLVSAQGAELLFAPGEQNDLERLAAPLAAETIAKPEAPISNLKGLTQYHPSFGGRAPEAPDSYNTRISEHLRHKGRAITIQDYERLVLGQFPQVYRVKCLNHTLGRRGEQEDYELCPGFVTLVVIPDLGKVRAVDIYQPRLPAADLQAIKDFLQDRLSPFIRLEVLNPIYETIRVDAKVRFYPGRSTTFFQEQLQADLRSFLAPWSANGESPEEDISFGGKIYYSTVLHFMESLSYVDVVINLRLIDQNGQEVEFVEAQNARSVLTTTSELHILSEVEESDLALPNNRGVGFDQILE